MESTADAEDGVMSENSDETTEKIKAIVAKETALIDKYGADVFDGYDGASGKAPVTVRSPDYVIEREKECKKEQAALLAKQKASERQE
jgi:hypothetical protein